MSRNWEHVINGEYRAPSSGDYLQEFVPRTGEPGDKIARGNAADVAIAVSAAEAAQAAWQALKPLDRGRILTEVARGIRRHAVELAEQEAKETGQPIWMAKGMIETSAQYFEFYGGLATSLHGDTIDIGPNYHVYSQRVPYGVVGVILPWNAPLNQAARAGAPALAAGNSVVAKPSEFTSISLLRFAMFAVEECGLPKGVFNVVTGTGKEVGEALVAHPSVRKVAFTGSLRAGREIGHVAAERIIPLTLELGGKSPNIVFEDADLSKAVPGSASAFTVNSGQVCIAGTRCLVQESIFDKFAEQLVKEVRNIRLSDGVSPGLGPLTTHAQYERVKGYFELARSEGVVALVGGGLPDQSPAPGWYVSPTVYTGVKPTMRIAREEIFGPVLALLPFKDEEDAINLANDTDYGLGAGIWTTNISRAHRVAARILAGQVFVNEYPSGGIETPFGGFKQSGYGREKGLEALHHYTQMRTVIIRL
jgi:aldehyde dehydrogenase (NAD+)